jgi:hypothetical protein
MTMLNKVSSFVYKFFCVLDKQLVTLLIPFIIIEKNDGKVLYSLDSEEK